MTVLTVQISFGQSDSCTIESRYTYLPTVNAAGIKCIAGQSDKKFTLFYTFGIWCSPCKAALSHIAQFAKSNQIDFYAVLVELETDSYYINRAVEYLNQVDSTMGIVILSDSLHSVKTKKKNKLIQVSGGSVSKKNKFFINEIYPADMEKTNDMGKCILINRAGEVKAITSYKDKLSKDDIYMGEINKLSEAIKMSQ